MYSRLRVPGVLQRFGISYFIVAVVGNVVSKFQNSENKEKRSQSNNNEKKTVGSVPLPGLFTDLIDLTPHWFIMAAILLAHQLIIWLVAAPGCPQVALPNIIFLKNISEGFRSIMRQ